MTHEGARAGMLAATMRQLWEAWLGNVGRPAVAGEAEEFRHAFAFADPILVRRAVDEYSSAGVDFLRLAGLRAVHARIASAARAGGADEAKRAEAERTYAAEWSRRRSFVLAGFQFTGEGPHPLDMVAVRELVLQHQDAWLEHPRVPARWDSDAARDAREAMRVARLALQRAGYEYSGHDSGPLGVLEIDLDVQVPGSWAPRALPPTAVKPSAQEQREREWRARSWADLQAQVAAWHQARAWGEAS